MALQRRRPVRATDDARQSRVVHQQRLSLPVAPSNASRQQ